jgi:hypothetical protein
MAYGRIDADVLAPVLHEAIVTRRNLRDQRVCIATGARSGRASPAPTETGDEVER